MDNFIQLILLSCVTTISQFFKKRKKTPRAGEGPHPSPRPSELAVEGQREPGKNSRTLGLFPALRIGKGMEEGKVVESQAVLIPGALGILSKMSVSPVRFSS